MPDISFLQALQKAKFSFLTHHKDEALHKTGQLRDDWLPGIKSSE